MKKNIITATLVAAVLASVAGPTVASTAQAASDSDVAHTTAAATPAWSTKKAVTFGATTNEQQFIQQIAPAAQQAANQYGVYASVMMAQAILESGWGTSKASQAPNFNFFGIKGDYNGASFNMPTKEWSKDRGYYSVDCYFRKYPDMAASFADNGNKLRNGVSWDSSYYRGTWRENAKSYRDATAWLQGRYATDPSYASKLNQLIETYNLTQYDNTTSVQTVSADANNQQGNFIVKIKADRKFAPIYTPLGVKDERYMLPTGSAWKSDQTRLINGVKCYRVATYEWVHADDVDQIK